MSALSVVAASLRGLIDMPAPQVCEQCESELSTILAIRDGDDDDFKEFLHVCENCFNTLAIKLEEASMKHLKYIEIGCRVCGTSLGYHLLQKGIPIRAECRHCWDKNEKEVNPAW